jgi:hypothetical protein
MQNSKLYVYKTGMYLSVETDGQWDELPQLSIHIENPLSLMDLRITEQLFLCTKYGLTPQIIFKGENWKITGE